MKKKSADAFMQTVALDEYILFSNIYIIVKLSGATEGRKNSSEYLFF